jgi:hypothetical protein
MCKTRRQQMMQMGKLPIELSQHSSDENWRDGESTVHAQTVPWVKCRALQP